MYISIEQALGIYDELYEAMNDGTINQIFIFELLPGTPMYSAEIISEEEKLREKKAAEDFHSICYIFSKNHDADIRINELGIHEWISTIRNESDRFIDRIDVQVLKKNKKNG